MTKEMWDTLYFVVFWVIVIASTNVLLLRLINWLWDLILRIEQDEKDGRAN